MPERTITENHGWVFLSGNPLWSPDPEWALWLVPCDRQRVLSSTKHGSYLGATSYYIQ